MENSFISEQKRIANEMQKQYMRFIRHGNINTVLKKGRKKLSVEHKEEVKKKRLEKLKQAKIDAGIPIRKRGRPRKNV